VAIVGSAAWSCGGVDSSQAVAEINAASRDREVDARFAETKVETKAQFAEMTADMNARFDKVDARFDRLETILLKGARPAGAP
jgi:predicted secreted Zn-dependent protease